MDKDVLASLMKRFPMKVLPNGNIRTCPVRISFPHVNKPRKGDSSEKYEVTLLFPKGADLTILNKAIEAKVVEAHGTNGMQLVKAEKISWPLSDQGKKKKDDGTLWDGCEPGAKACTAKTENQPRLKDASLNDIAADKIYPGCWALVTVHAYSGTYKGETTTKKYASVGLNNIQFIADDERFGGSGGSNPDEEFESLDGNAPSGFDDKAPAGGDAYDFG